MATVRLSPDQEAKLRYLAALRGSTLADLYREAVDEYLAREMPADWNTEESDTWHEMTGVSEASATFI